MISRTARHIAMGSLIVLLLCVAAWRWWALLRVETCEEAAAALLKQAPAGYSVVVCDPFVIVHNVTQGQLNPATQALAQITLRCQALIALERGKRTAPIRVYFFNTLAEYRQHYAMEYGGQPSSDLGVATLSKRSLYGSADVGLGTLTHEAVHLLIMEIFIRWLDEAGKLPAFYRAYRDGRDAATALLEATGLAPDKADLELARWILSHDENILLQIL